LHSRTSNRVRLPRVLLTSREEITLFLTVSKTLTVSRSKKACNGWSIIIASLLEAYLNRSSSTNRQRRSTKNVRLGTCERLPLTWRHSSIISVVAKPTLPHYKTWQVKKKTLKNSRSIMLIKTVKNSSKCSLCEKNRISEVRKIYSHSFFNNNLLVQPMRTESAIQLCPSGFRLAWTSLHSSLRKSPP
jgi:hypothetical protein